MSEALSTEESYSTPPADVQQPQQSDTEDEDDSDSESEAETIPAPDKGKEQVILDPSKENVDLPMDVAEQPDIEDMVRVVEELDVRANELNEQDPPMPILTLDTRIEPGGDDESDHNSPAGSSPTESILEVSSTVNHHSAAIEALTKAIEGIKTVVEETGAEVRRISDTVSMDSTRMTTLENKLHALSASFNAYQTHTGDVIASILRAQKQKTSVEITKITEDLIPPAVVEHQPAGPALPTASTSTAGQPLTTPPRVVVADLGDWDL